MPSLLKSAIKLLHKKEREEFFAMCEALSGHKIDWPETQSTKVWFWGLRRWGRRWCEEESKSRDAA